MRIPLVAGVLVATVGASPLAAQSTYEQLQTFSGVLSQIRTNYVDSVEVSHLVRAAITGMLRSLDPHSRYVSHEDYELRSSYDRRLAGGTGLILEDGDGSVVVLGIVPRSPAAKAGVQAGDRIRSLNDSAVAGLDAGELQDRQIGEKGTRVRLTFERGRRFDPDTFSVTLKRDILDEHVVPPPRMLDKTTGYVRLAEFSEGSPKELHGALDKLRGMGARQLVLDLRSNPGGDIDAMIDIASMFLPARTQVFHTEGRKKTGVDSVSTRGAGEFVQMPLVILIDQGSASASEMLTGTLQDHDRALVVGRRSFGKALMQMALPLPNGDRVWLTTARVVTPSGRLIQRRYQGIGAAQYYALAGKSGAAPDTSAVYHTDHGRPVRGGGGIVPDVPVVKAEWPVWLSVAADSGFISAVADSVAATLAATPAGRAAWTADAAAWDRALLPALLARVGQRLHVMSAPDAAARARLARLLAIRVAEVRWGDDAAEDLALRSDDDITAALGQFPSLAQSLGGH